MALIAIDWHPDRKKLRAFALLWLVAFGAAGAVVAWRAGLLGAAEHQTATWTRPFALWAAAILLPAVGLPFPRAIKPIYVLWMGASYPIGWVVSHALLAATYFGLFTLVGGIFRLVGRDALGLKMDRAASTYWVRRASRTDPRRYFRQF